MSRLSESKPRHQSLALIGDHPLNAAVLAALLFAAIYVLRLAVGTFGDAITFLYVVPVVLAAIALGTRAGLIAAAMAFALSSQWAIAEEIPVSALGYANRAIVFLFVGGLAGHFATRLRSLEAESARHFELSRDMICIAGFDGYFKRVNPAFERILGYPAQELLGRPFVDFVHPDDRERTLEEAAEIGNGAGSVRFQNRYLDKHGEVHWIEWTSVAILEQEEIYAVARDVTDRKALEEELERLSQRDPLTGLFNRRRFDEELQKQLAYTRRYGNGGALLLLDLDRFKEINDEYGHAAGDEALCAVAEALQANLRISDTIGRDAAGIVARLGGDEFAVLLPEVDAEEARAVADRLVAAVAAVEPTFEGRPSKLAVSVGIALYDEYGCPPAEDLAAAADRAMYEAKARGGSSVALL